MAQSTRELEKVANQAARSFMGKTAWFTVIFGLVIAVLYVATLLALIFGSLHLFPAFLICSVLTYAAYTVLHDAVHGSINGQNKSRTWLNNAMGYLAGQIMFVSFKAHRLEHLAHHHYTNQPGKDPDLYLDDDSLWSLIKGTLRVLPLQYIYFFKDGSHKVKSRDKWIVGVELVIMISWRLAFVAIGLWVEALVLFFGALFVGVFALVVLFVWLVHRPHDETERYKNTNTLTLPKPIDTLVSWLWLFQNYHSIHHLFPKVPFYHYKNLYNEIEDIMVANDAPIIRLG